MDRRKRTQFWGADEDDDSLVLEILAGKKTATACQAHEYFKPAGEFDDGGMEVGDLVDVFDLKGRPRCVIHITAVYRFKFGDVPERLWRAEGCQSAEEFREAHRRAWPHENLTDDFELIATHFEPSKMPALKTAKVSKAHVRSIPVAPTAKAGATVVFERIDENNPAWFFGRDVAGIAGYFPVGWFDIDAAARNAVALRDYDANELSVGAGDIVEPFEEYGSWLQVRHCGRTGWVPLECVEAR